MFVMSSLKICVSLAADCSLLAYGKWDATVNQKISLKHEKICKQPTQAMAATSSQLAERETCLNQPEAKQPTFISRSFVPKL